MTFKWYQKALHFCMIASPVVAILLLIGLVYFGYVFSYLFPLLNAGTSKIVEYPFSSTSSEETAPSKGLWLLITVSFFTGMMLINFARAVFMDPGYFPSPVDLENNIVYRQAKIDSKTIDEVNVFKREAPLVESKKHTQLFNKFQFLTHFSETISNGPLFSKEGEHFSNNITHFMKDSNDRTEKEERLTGSLSIKFTDADTIEIRSSKKTKEEDIYNNFEYVDLTKTLLCGTCLRYKVERSHHCRLCGKCVLKMDHHCPWLANCIGFRNYKYFLLIHFHGIISSLIVAFTYWEVIVNAQVNNETSLFMCWISLFIYLCNFGLLGFLSWLILVNWRLAFANLTVIENSDRERFPSTKALNIYDLGCYRNFCSVFGDNPLVWFLPFGANTKGEGIVYDNIYKVRSLEKGSY